VIDGVRDPIRAAEVATQQAAAVTVRGLVKSYGRRKAVRGIDLNVQRGEILSAAGAALTCTSDAVDDLTAAIRHALASSDLTERAALIAGDNAAMPDTTELARHIAALDF
jgi:hypothetical protein